MEEIKTTFEDIVLPIIDFSAKFDPLSGRLLAVGPSMAFENDQFKMPIEEDIALQIISGKMLLDSCKVNILENKLEISEEKSLFKIDDVLHRIAEKKFSNLEKIDLLIKFNEKEKTFLFSLAEDLGGTLINPTFKNTKKRKLIWKGETLMNFYITDYNDPNVLHDKLEIPLADLDKKDYLVKINKFLPKHFSIYTRRIFKNYVFEYENN